MRVAVIARTLYPIRPPFTGGLEAFTHALVNYLTPHCEVDLYAHESSETGAKLFSFTHNYTAVNRAGSRASSSTSFSAGINSSVQDPRRQSSLSEDCAAIFENDEYLRIIRTLECKRYDVIHNNSLSPLFLLYAAQQDRPVITTLHTPPYSALKAAAQLASKRHHCEFVAVSESLARQWRPFLANGCKVVHNGIDTKFWDRKRESSDYLLCYGRLVPNKGIDIALAVAHALDLPLKIAGARTDTNYYNSQIEPLLDSKREYVGHQSHDQISRLYRHAKAALFPIRWEEPFGLATVEAMAAGVPVVAFDRGAFSELIGTEEGIITPRTTVDAMCEGVQNVHRLNPDKIKARGQSFPLSKMCDRYLTLYRAAV